MVMCNHGQNISYLYCITMISGKCCICGTVKNCGKYLEKVLENMETIGAIFSSFKIIISYDVSIDNSLEILQKKL